MSFYQNKNNSINERVEDLLGIMTLEEKIGQMMQLPANRPGFEQFIEKYKVGSYLHAVGDTIRYLQDYNRENSRLNIPLIFGIDAIHGHCFEDHTTVFPTQLAMACTWNSTLIKSIGQITANEAAACGLNWTFSPVLCIGRDPRWGRTDETFGEDSVLVAEFAQALAEGYQSGERPFAACAKHFAVYGETDGGRDSSDADVSERRIRNLFLPPFEKLVKSGCKTIMAAYQSLNGIPCSANTWLMNTVLRDEWQFDGVVVTDWDNVGQIITTQKAASNMTEAVALCLQASNDIFMATPDFFHCALALVEEGRIRAERIDASVRRILWLKFELGLFDTENNSDRESEHKTFRSKVFSDSRRWDIALQTAEQSLVLVKNQNRLPLTGVERIVLIGDNADDVLAQLGDWSFGSGQAAFTDTKIHRQDTVTLLQALREYSQTSQIQLEYIHGCGPENQNTFSLQDHNKKITEADVIIFCAGDTYAQHGEYHDRADLKLPGNQQPMFEQLVQSEKPIVSVLLMSKPHIIDRVLDYSDSVLIAFNPGAKGGVAITRCLFGEINPGGKLPISFPRHEGQLPVYYNQAPGWHAGYSKIYRNQNGYIDIADSPLLAFGEGISYSHIVYYAPEINPAIIGIDQLKNHKQVNVTIEVENQSDRDAIEIVQLYLQQIILGVTSPTRQLKKFHRAVLPARGKTKIHFQLAAEDFKVLDRNLKKNLEPGVVEIMVGKSSRDQDLRLIRLALH